MLDYKTCLLLPAGLETTSTSESVTANPRLTLMYYILALEICDGSVVRQGLAVIR